MIPREGICATCGHEWSRHDPEDGTCDAPCVTEHWSGACPCGRRNADHLLAAVRAEEREMCARELERIQGPCTGKLAAAVCRARTAPDATGGEGEVR
jgi:hypothetical protein